MLRSPGFISPSVYYNYVKCFFSKQSKASRKKNKINFSVSLSPFLPPFAHLRRFKFFFIWLLQRLIGKGACCYLRRSEDAQTNTNYSINIGFASDLSSGMTGRKGARIRKSEGNRIHIKMDSTILRASKCFSFDCYFYRREAALKEHRKQLIFQVDLPSQAKLKSTFDVRLDGKARGRS